MNKRKESHHKMEAMEAKLDIELDYEFDET